jgi:predicted molibdopterin-dependent oxidoreductase YjgC
MGAVDMGVVPTAGGMKAQDMLTKAKVLYVMGADPARDNPSFRNPGFLIVQDLFLTDTAQKADVVLPATSWAERDGTYTNTERRVQYFARALSPMGQARADWEIIRDVAKQLGARWEYDSAADVMNEITQRVPLYAQMTHARLRVTARRRASVQTVGGDSAEPVQIALGELFSDVSGIQWASASETNPDAKFAVKFIAPKEVAAASEPYMAVTRALLDRGSAMQFSQIVQPRVPAAHVEINSHDAEEWNIGDGDRVKITLETKPPRVMQVNAQVDGHVPPGVIALANNLDGTLNLPMGARVKIEKA